jgi:prolyl oligopeptidase
MKLKILVAAMVMLPVVLVAQNAARLKYPDAKKGTQVDDYFGTKVADPYRWLENADSAETRAWVEAENKVTFGYLDRIAERKPIQALLTKLWNYERYGVPSKEGDWYILGRNDGLQNQSVIYRAKTLDTKPEILLDPNKLSADGTVAVMGATFTDDGKYMAYALQTSGSDWREWHVREVATGRDLPDVIKWSKFSGADWKKDGTGFFYGRYAQPKAAEELQGVNRNQKLYFHAVGTPQEKDVLVYERPDKPDWGFGASVTDDGHYLVIAQSEGTETKNRVFLEDLRTPSSQVEPFLNIFDAEYTVVGNDGDRFYVKTDKGAPRGRLVAIDRRRPLASSWKVLIPEGPGKEVLSGVTMVADRFVAIWQVDAHDQVKIYNLEGKLERDVLLPGLGSVSGFSGRRAQKEGFYGYTSFTYPTTIYRYDFTAGKADVFKKPKTPFNADAYETKQVFYTSKDGTRVPMFITARKGVKLDGQHATYLYGYGGFNIPVTPGYSPAIAGWLEMGGVYAVANIRGGSEYGNAWHDAGRLKNKQNVFDDFIAAAEYLIKEKYTSTPKLAIGGGSNGGLLVGACLTQRPDLFGAALPAVGVMDMLRFNKFTIGWAWTSDYGSSETRDGFDTLIKYSPLHTIKPGTKYPATFITTADHDDRVVPAHSFKFTATLQTAQAGDAPILIRIETKAGHGAGTPTSKQIEERADGWAFLVKVLGMKLPAGIG